MENNQDNRWITSLTYTFFVGLSAICLLLHFLAHRTKSQQSSASNQHFLHFQKKYFLVYFLALFGDWLQGPYIYKLYSHYGFVESQIAVLYVVGFAASVLLGTGIGALADRCGRKRMCIVFSLTYSLCCLTKISSNYYILMVGRLLGGISTSLLFSVFESWYVHEHIHTYDFPKEWISVTFYKATFWNGILAIIAGIIANITSEGIGFGPVSPFLTSIPFLLLSGIIVSKTWNENYGETKTLSSHSCVQGLRLILYNEKIFVLGIVQSLFESVMYIFVFLWTPILDHSHPPLGLVFSVFMVCIMIGSLIYQLLSVYLSSQGILSMTVIFSMISMVLCSYATAFDVPFLRLAYSSFLFLEVAVGIYFPAIGYLKSQLIPESYRANIMNWFRVPLNIITCAVLIILHNSDHGNHMIFIICTAMMCVATVLMWRFCKLLEKEPPLCLEEGII